MSSFTQLVNSNSWIVGGARRISMSAVELDLIAIADTYSSLRDQIKQFNMDLYSLPVQQHHNVTHSITATCGDSVDIDLKIYRHDTDACDYKLQVSLTTNSLLYQLYCTIWHYSAKGASYLLTNDNDG